MSEEIIIARESASLSGTVHIGGAKNSALKLIAASLLGRGSRLSTMFLLFLISK